MTIEELTKYLEEECKGCSTIEEYFAAFERMALLPVSAEYPIEYDELMAEYGTYDWHMGKGTEFEVTLSRSINDGGDEYLCTVIDIFYEPAEWNEKLHSADQNFLGEDGTHEDFMAKIRAAEEYRACIGKAIKRVRIYNI